MASHELKMKIEHEISVGYVDVEFSVRRGGKHLGRVKLSQGGIDWTPAHTSKPHELGWVEFGELMKQNGVKKT
jgi:hypothetical protein